MLRTSAYTLQMVQEMKRAGLYLDTLAERDICLSLARETKRFGHMALASAHIQQARDANRRLVALVKAGV